MAEALAIVGLVSAIVQFVDFGIKVVERLDEFNSDIHEVPKTFQAVKVQLPLLIDTLRRTQQQASAGLVSDETATALKPLIDACSAEIEILQRILDKNLKAQKSSGLQRRLQALRSLADDKDVERSITKLEGHIRLLTFYQSTNNSDSSHKLLALRQTNDATPHQPRKPIFMVPFDPDETFFGRKDIMDSVDQKLNSLRRRAVLSGIGGVGKSQIAIQYCYQYKSKHPDSHVLWVHCGSVARFDQGYKEIARRLKVPGTQDPETDVVKIVFDWLSDEDSGPWLLVLDNADDQGMFFEPAIRSQSDDVLQQQLGMLAQYLPRSAHGMTLVTTRDRRVGERFAERDKPIIVLPLEIADATAMLRSRLPNHLDLSAAEVAELLESLQYLPLAIAQAASYISEEDVTLARYLELLRPGNADAKLLLEQDYYDPKRHADIHNSVFQTWRLSFDQIQRQTPRAAEILSLMSMLDKQSIPRRLLHDGKESPVLVDKALGTLKNFSLIHEEKTHQTYGIHRLVQLSTHWWLEQQKTLARWQERALDVVLTHHPSSVNVEDWEAWESISPHIAVVQQYHFEQQERKLQYANITSWIGQYYQAVGRYGMALKMHEGALTVCRALLGEEHPSTLSSMHDLASVLDDQGKYKEAGAMYRQTMELRETILGKEHQSTLDSMNDLAIVLQKQGKYEEAEKMHREELELCQKIRGKEHPSTLSSMNNLALVLDHQGKYEEAEIIYRQTIELEYMILGKEHPSTLDSMNNLALLLDHQGKYEEAEIIYRQTIELKETILGKEHPSTLGSMSNLAVALSNQGKYEEAEIMHRQTLELRQTIVGKEHPSTLDSMNNLALALENQGKYEEAEIMHREGLELCQKVLGKENPSTLNSMNNLAIVLGDQGKYEEAEMMHRQTLKLKEAVLGNEHPSTLRSINNLAFILDDQGKREEAEAVRQRKLPSNEDRPD